MKKISLVSFLKNQRKLLTDNFKNCNLGQDKITGNFHKEKSEKDLKNNTIQDKQINKSDILTNDLNKSADDNGNLSLENKSRSNLF